MCIHVCQLNLASSASNAVLCAIFQVVSLDLVRCLDEAGSRGHLCITVPWLVEYMSLMDSQAALQPQLHSLLLLLVAIYKSDQDY